MAVPLIAAGIAARAIAKKLATRTIGGITGAGAKNVAPTYRNIEPSVKVQPQSRDRIAEWTISSGDKVSQLYPTSTLKTNVNVNKAINKYIKKLPNELKPVKGSTVKITSAKSVLSTVKLPTIKINSGNMRAR